MVNHTRVMNPDFLCCSPYYGHKQAGQQHKVIKQTETNTCSQICHATSTLTTHSKTTSNTTKNYINFKVQFSLLHGASQNWFIWLQVKMNYIHTKIQGGSNMTGTNCDLFTHKYSQSYLNHLVPWHIAQKYLPLKGKTNASVQGNMLHTILASRRIMYNIQPVQMVCNQEYKF
jgi:hypothetical protein